MRYIYAQLFRLSIALVFGVDARRTGLLVVIEQDAMGGALQIVELAGADCPEKCRHDDRDEQHRQWNQKIKNIH